MRIRLGQTMTQISVTTRRPLVRATGAFLLASTLLFGFTGAARAQALGYANDPQDQAVAAPADEDTLVEVSNLAASASWDDVSAAVLKEAR